MLTKLLLLLVIVVCVCNAQNNGCVPYNITGDCKGVWGPGVTSVLYNASAGSYIFLKSADSTALQQWQAAANNGTVKNTEDCKRAYIANACSIFTGFCVSSQTVGPCQGVCIDLEVACFGTTSSIAPKSCALLAPLIYAPVGATCKATPPITNDAMITTTSSILAVFIVSILLVF